MTRLADSRRISEMAAGDLLVAPLPSAEWKNRTDNLTAWHARKKKSCKGEAADQQKHTEKRRDAGGPNCQGLLYLPYLRYLPR